MWKQRRNLRHIYDANGKEAAVPFCSVVVYVSHGEYLHTEEPVAGETMLLHTLDK